MGFDSPFTRRRKKKETMPGKLVRKLSRGLSRSFENNPYDNPDKINLDNEPPQYDPYNASRHLGECAGLMNTSLDYWSPISHKHQFHAYSRPTMQSGTPLIRAEMKISGGRAVWHEGSAICRNSTPNPHSVLELQAEHRHERFGCH